MYVLMDNYGTTEITAICFNEVTENVTILMSQNTNQNENTI